MTPPPPPPLQPPKKKTPGEGGRERRSRLSNVAATFKPPEKRTATAIGIRFFVPYHL